ncbi:hypothetical protein [Bifidobacterium scaligerum]|uniref:Uncharacterized protein n=1 Tax=Bifidobacterium scaligerum TaxID=2052656 RepID=A0A2M9HS41_9BIFI|nr:hypothetical protein [Bifidobacterium scaligerum]PJM79645.1 hypothetical protein CUU80_00340 [Bifidobacterium scaligerum]
MNERNIETRHISITSASADGTVTRTEVHITSQQRRIDVDGGCGTGGGRYGSACGEEMSSFTNASDETSAGDCFDPSTCCDAREQALIAALRAYLRPDEAPECLMARLKATLDHCCGE